MFLKGEWFYVKGLPCSQLLYLLLVDRVLDLRPPPIESSGLFCLRHRSGQDYVLNGPLVLDDEIYFKVGRGREGEEPVSLPGSLISTEV